MHAKKSEYPDWSREAKPLFSWLPSRSLLKSLRLYQKYSNQSGTRAFFLKKYAVLCNRFWSVVTGADIPVNSDIAGGLLIPHPNGIVIHPRAKIGPNCLIFQQVTIGGKVGSELPIIGKHVDVGAGAKILGGVTIGDFAKIGANSVVLIDVPPGKTAVGAPARIVDI